MSDRLNEEKHQKAIQLVESLEHRLFEQISTDSLNLKSMPFLYSTMKAVGLNPEECNDWLFIEKAIIEKQRLSQLRYPIVNFSGNFIEFGNITCTDANGNIFEQYVGLEVCKNIFKNSDNKKKTYKSYDAILCCEKNNLLLPSFALTCNIIATLYKNRDKQEINEVLMQYKDNGNGYGWHMQNTIVDWGAEKIIHYPHDSNFPKKSGNYVVNGRQHSIVLEFDRKNISDKTLEDALKIPNYHLYLKNLTGLQDPSILIDVGEYFGMLTRIGVSASNEIRVCLIGGYYDLLNFNSNNFFDYAFAIRGVRKIFNVK